MLRPCNPLQLLSVTTPPTDTTPPLLLLSVAPRGWVGADSLSAAALPSGGEEELGTLRAGKRGGVALSRCPVRALALGSVGAWPGWLLPLLPLAGRGEPAALGPSMGGSFGRVGCPVPARGSCLLAAATAARDESSVEWVTVREGSASRGGVGGDSSEEALSPAALLLHAIPTPTARAAALPLGDPPSATPGTTSSATGSSWAVFAVDPDPCACDESSSPSC